MRSNFPPEPVETDLSRGGARPRGLEDTGCDAQTRVGCHDFHAGHPLSHLTTLSGGDVTVLAVIVVHGRDLKPGLVCQRFGGPEVSEETAIARNDWEIRGGGRGGNWRVRPWSMVFSRICSGERKSAKGDTEIEIGEDELDAVVLCQFLSFVGKDYLQPLTLVKVMSPTEWKG